MRQFLILLLALVVVPVASGDIWVNEIHYDNTGADTGEFIEIFVSSDETTAASAIFVELLNGVDATGAVYGSVALDDPGITSFAVSGGTMYVIDISDFGVSGIQNGTPDGMAIIIDPAGDHVFDGTSDSVVQFLSYEGVMTTTDAFYVAAGVTSSTDIGVSESSSTPVGASLHLIGTGSAYADFTWAVAAADTAGAINTGQTITVPEPSSIALMSLLLLGLGLRRRKSA